MPNAGCTCGLVTKSPPAPDRRIVVEPARPVQRELHERRERDRGRRRGCAFGSRRPESASHGRSMASTCEDERRGRATHPPRRVGGLRARRRHGEPEVLVVRRSPESRFLPGYVAFPGGAVDADDEAHAERWFGDPALAPRAAAVRELVEEAGITLTAAGLVASDGFGADRRRAAAPEQLSGAVPLGGSARGAGSLRCALLHGRGRRRRRRPRPTAPR